MYVNCHEYIGLLNWFFVMFGKKKLLSVRCFNFILNVTIGVFQCERGDVPAHVAPVTRNGAHLFRSLANLFADLSDRRVMWTYNTLRGGNLAGILCNVSRRRLIIGPPEYLADMSRLISTYGTPGLGECVAAGQVFKFVILF